MATQVPKPPPHLLLLLLLPLCHASTPTILYTLVGNVTHTTAVLAVGVTAPASTTPAVPHVEAHNVGGNDDLVVDVLHVFDSTGNPTKDVPDFQPYGVVKFILTGLAHVTEYTYTVTLGDSTKTGSFRTFPIPFTPADFSFVFSSCAWTGSNSVVFDAIRDAHPLFYLNAGDLFYGDIADNDEALYADPFHKTLTAPRQQALYASTAFVYVWDDHDFGPNNSDGSMECGPAAASSYRRTVPHYTLSVDTQDGLEPQPARSIHHAFTVGTARFIVTDLRSQRVPRFEDDGPAKTCLGGHQLEWLLAEFEAAADHDVVFWVSTMPFHDAQKKWGWYQHERGVIVDALAALRLSSKVIVLSGDAHMLAVDDGSNAPGGVTVFHASALDQRGSVKGGPYSKGPLPGNGQWARVSLSHTKDGVCVTYDGHRTTPTETTVVLTHTHCVDAVSRPKGAPSQGPRRRVTGALHTLRSWLIPASFAASFKSWLRTFTPYTMLISALRSASPSQRLAMVFIMVALMAAALFVAQFLCRRAVSTALSKKDKQE